MPDISTTHESPSTRPVGGDEGALGRRSTLRWTRARAALVVAVGLSAALSLSGVSSAQPTRPPSPAPRLAGDKAVALRPDGVVAPFSVVRSGMAAAAVDDPVSQPTSVPADDYIRASSVGRSTTLTMATTNLAGAAPAPSQAWFYSNTGTTTRLRVELLWGGAVRASTTVAAGQGFGWRSIAFTPPDQSAVDDLQLRLTSLDGGDTNTRAAYVSLMPAGRSAVQLRPDGVVAPFSVVRSGMAAAAVDDPVSQPTSVPADDYIRASSVGRSTTLTMATTNLAGAAPAPSQAWFYSNTGTTTRLRVELLWGGAVRASTTVAAGQGFGWRSIAFTPPDQSAVDDLQLRLTSLDGGDTNTRAAYVSLDPTSCTPAYGTFSSTTWPSACWRPYAGSSPFNIEVSSSAPLAASSANIVNRVLHDIPRHPRPANLVAHTHGSSGEPTYYVRSDDPSTFRRYQVTCTEYGGSCSIDRQAGHLPAGIPIPSRAVPEGTSVPASTEPAAGTDRHLTVVDQTTGWEYDLWHVQWPANGDQLTIGNGGRTRIDGDGTATHEGGDGTAAGFGDLAGRVRAEELAAGSIHHALFINIACDNGTFVRPAWKRADHDCASVKKRDPSPSNLYAPPMGSRFQLRLDSATIDGLSIPTWKKTLLHAMADYGMFFGDTSGTDSTGQTDFAFSIETESGDQYTSLGAQDRWLQVAADNDWPLVPAKTGYPFEHRLGYFGLDADNTVINSAGLTWADVWSRLVVVAPCVSAPSGC